MLVVVAVVVAASVEVRDCSLAVFVLLVLEVAASVEVRDFS